MTEKIGKFGAGNADVNVQYHLRLSFDEALALDRAVLVRRAETGRSMSRTALIRQYVLEGLSQEKTGRMS